MNEKLLEELNQTLKLYSPKTLKKLSIVSKEDLGQSELFHIATQRFTTLLPNVSKRAGWTEDNTIPRVHTSPTLLGCIDGYASMYWMAMNEPPTGKKKDDYRGGYYIYFIPFDYALKPSKQLVYDVDLTDEHWLVAYNTLTRQYKPSAIGRLVVSTLTLSPSSEGKIKQLLNVYIEIPADAKLRLHEDVWLKEGYWFLELERASERNETKVNKYSSISKSVFETEHQEHAALLSYENPQFELMKAW